ncbi:hypothetical protein LINPERHAP2_LOCUS26021 [Linum perenne]
MWIFSRHLKNPDSETAMGATIPAMLQMRLDWCQGDGFWRGSCGETEGRSLEETESSGEAQQVDEEMEGEQLVMLVNNVSFD